MQSYNTTSERVSKFEKEDASERQREGPIERQILVSSESQLDPQ